MLGAIGAGDGLKAQYLVIHVESVDGAVLKKKLADAGQSSAIAPLVMMATDNVPKFVIDTAIPVAVKKLQEYGVTANIVAQDAPPAQGGRKRSELLYGVAAGAGLTALVAGIGWTAWVTIFRKIIT